MGQTWFFLTLHESQKVFPDSDLDSTVFPCRVKEKERKEFVCL